MPGLVPGIRVFYRPCSEDVDGRDKPGHDAGIVAMHDIKWIRENPTEFDRLLARRNLDSESSRRFSAANLLSIDERRRAIIRVHERALTRRKAASKENE